MAALADLLPPPVFVELGPVQVGPLLCVGVELIAELKDPVLDQVSRQERSPAVVQRLENELIVIAQTEVDGHEVKTRLEHVGERLDTRVLVGDGRRIFNGLSILVR